MPVRAFWSFVASITRIRADADQRQLSLMIGSQSKEGIASLNERLNEELGKPVEFESTDDFDIDGWNLLKRMAGETIGKP